MTSRAAAAASGSAALLLLAVFMLALASGSASARQQPTDQAIARQADPADSGPLVPPGDPPDLTLLYTGGVVGYVEPCG